MTKTPTGKDDAVAKHTPGPWMYRPNPGSDAAHWTFHIDVQGTPGKMNWGQLLAACWGYWPDGQAEANARLIAAAPDLLSACKAARELYDHLSLGSLEAAAKYGDSYEPPTEAECLKVREDLEVAILKAEPTP